MSSVITRRKGLVTNQGGQAMIMAIFFLVVLAIGTYTSFSLGYTVSNKVYLQNVADTTAYSMAVSEARTFNFIAFANRTQIAHYAAVMSLQGLVSWASFSEAFLGTVADGLAGISAICKDIAKVCSWLTWIPYIGAIIAAIGEVLNAVGQAAGAAAQIANITFNIFRALVTGVDYASAAFNWMLIVLNWLYWAASWAMGLATATILIDDGYDFTQYNNELAGKLSARPIKIAKPKGWGVAFGILSAYKFNQAFDPVGGAPIPVSANGTGKMKLTFAYPKLFPTVKAQTSDDVKGAQIIMTEMVNASRYDNFMLDRGLGATAKSSMSNFDKQLDKLNNVDSDNKTVRKKVINKLQDLLSGLALVFDIKTGQSKLVSDKQQSGSNKFDDNLFLSVQKNSIDNSLYSRGTAMASFDALAFYNTTPIRAWRYGVYAGINGSYHCRYVRDKRPKDTNSLISTIDPDSLKSVAWAIKGIDGSYRECKQENAVHPWKGIQPYMKFMPKSSRHDYNQPDTWVALNIPPEDDPIEAASGGSVKQMKMTMKADGYSATFEGDIGQTALLNNGFMSGVNAISRGQAYYHRPGVWREHPNFFNPFWRARLAPIGDVVDDLLELIPNADLGKLSDLLQKGIIPH